MLAAFNRLRSARDIARVYKKGSYGAGGGLLSVKATPSGRPESRAVIVVGKKVDKRAVVRNLIRRRTSGELLARWTTVEPGYDIVISVHADISHLPMTDLGHHLGTALSRARVTTS